MKTARKLLWVDDDTTFAHMVSNYLRVWGFELDVTPRRPDEPKEALVYDGLVWDHTFTEAEDRDFLRNVRAETKGRNLPILLLYSRDISLEERLFVNEQRIGHSRKWISLWALLQKIQEIVE